MKSRVIQLCTALVMLLSLQALAQTSPIPVTHLGGPGDPNFRGEPSWGNPPATAAKLIFYGGDINVDDPNAYSFANGNTLLVPNTATYGAVVASKEKGLVVTGLLFNEVANVQTGKIFDPAIATYDVRKYVMQGNGGVEMAHGSGPQSAVPTGRMPFGFVEYAVSVRFAKPLVPQSGTYYLNLSSQCTTESNQNCSLEQLFVDNTTQQTNAINPNWEPEEDLYINSDYFGYIWQNWCSLGLNSQQCGYLSFGVYGQL